MKLFLLKLLNGSRMTMCDTTFGLVIRAESEQRARELACKETVEEYQTWNDRTFKFEPSYNKWMHESDTSCVEITDNWPAQILLVDYNSH